MKKLTTKQIISIILVLLFLIFAGQNVGPVQMKFLFFGFDLPLIILLAFVFFIGFITAKIFTKKEDKKNEPVSKETIKEENAKENN